MVKSADQTGARRVTLSLGEKVDPETFFVRIERADSDGSRTTVGIERLEWSNDGWEVTIHLDEAFQNGGYDAVFDIARPEGADGNAAECCIDARDVPCYDLAQKIESVCTSCTNLPNPPGLPQHPVLSRRDGVRLGCKVTG